MPLPISNCPFWGIAVRPVPPLSTGMTPAPPPAITFRLLKYRNHSREIRLFSPSVSGTRADGICVWMLATCRRSYDLSAHDGDLHGVCAADFVHTVAQLDRHAQPAPDHALACLANLAARLCVIVRPSVPAVIRPAKAHLGVVDNIIWHSNYKMALYIARLVYSTADV